MKKTERTNNATINTTANNTMEEEVMREERTIIEIAKIALSNVEEIIGVTDYTMNRYLSIVEELINNGFDTSDLRKIINNIYCFAEDNNIDIYNIDITPTNSNDKCIFFDADVYMFKEGVRMKVRLRINYYENELQFIEGSCYDYSTDSTKYVGTVDQLMEAINGFSTQGD